MASAVSVLPTAPDAQTMAAAKLPIALLGPLAAADPGLVERLFDCARDTLFFVKNRRAQYVSINQALADRCGASCKSELLGRTARDLFPDPLGAAYYAQDRHVLDTGTELRDHLQLTPRDIGRWGWSLSYKFPLTDPHGDVIGLCGICKDVDAVDARPLDLHEPEPTPPPLARAVAYIQQHYTECVRIEHLAQLTGLTSRQLERLIKRHYHLTPVQLLARTRIDAAMQQLTQSRDSIAKVASACGYSDQSAFTRQFKAAVGMTPSRFRAVARGEDVSASLM